MSAIRWQPINETMENLLKGSFDRAGFQRQRPNLDEMAIDAYETATELVITAAIIGASRDDLVVTFEDRTLTIEGTVKEPKLPDGARRLLQERRYGTVSRTLRLPNGIDSTQTHASFQNGILQIHLPKVEGTQKKTIAIS